MKEVVESLLRKALRGEQSAWPAQIGMGTDAVADGLSNEAGDGFPDESGDGLKAQLLVTCMAQGIAPMLSYIHASSGCLAQWPQRVVSKLKNEAINESVREMVMEEELVELLDDMDAEGIRPILIKGTALSYTLYPQRGLRPRCDTDLLIDAAQAEQVTALMKRRGYEALFESSGEFVSSQTAFSKADASGSVHSFDVHRQISNSSKSFSDALNYAELLTRTVAIPDLGENARMLALPDALLLGCFHRAASFANEGEKLIWLHDIYLLCEALDEAALEAFYMKAESLEISELCADGILKAREWFGTQLPEPFVTRLESPSTPEASTAYLQREGKESRIKQHVLIEAGKLSWREKLQLFMQKAFPSPQYMRYRYRIKSKILLPFYYIYRLFYGLYVFIKG